MIPDLSFVKNSFKKFNTEIFKSQLPEPVFRLTRAKTFRGKLKYKIERSLSGRKNKDFELRISISFDLEEHVWEDVVIHEMIHLYIAANHIKDTSSHGPVFKKMMHSINREFGRAIVVSVRTTASQALSDNADKRLRAHYICIAKFKDGRLGVAPVAKTRIFKLWDYFKNFPDVISIKWIGSIDPWFNSLPHVQSPKLFIIKKEILSDHLKGAVLLDKSGKTIRPVIRRYSRDELLP